MDNNIYLGFFILWYISKIVAPSGICTEQQSTIAGGKLIYFQKKFCCANYEMVNDKCQECSVGYFSERAGNCTPCKDNTYGIRCADTCKCAENERCHHVTGCVSIESTSLTQTDSATQSSSTITKITTTESLEDPESSTKWKITTESSSTFIRINSVTNTTKDIDGFQHNNPQQNKPDYLISVAVVGSIILLSIACIIYKVNNKKNAAWNPNIQNGQINQMDASQSDVTEIIASNVYEEIDEQNMCSSLILQSNSNIITLNRRTFTTTEHDEQRTTQLFPLTNQSFETEGSYINLYERLETDQGEKPHYYTRCKSVQYLEIIDVPAKTEDSNFLVENIKTNKRKVQTL